MRLWDRGGVRLACASADKEEWLLSKSGIVTEGAR